MRLVVVLLQIYRKVMKIPLKKIQVLFNFQGLKTVQCTC